jgi:hypothetical protein
MLQHLKPTEAAIKELALAETDPAQQSRFTPLRWGFPGNLALIVFAAGAGFVHALLAALWRRAFSPSRDGTG